MNELLILDDWMTSVEVPIFTKLTIGDTDHYFHKHLFYEFFYVTEGTIEHFMNGETETIKAGDMFFLNLDDSHAFLREEGNLCAHRDVVIRKDFFDALCEFIAPNFHRDYQNGVYAKRVHLPMQTIEELENRITEITLMPSTAGSLKMANIRTLIISMLDHLLQYENKQVVSKYPGWFEELLDRMNSHEHMKNGLDDILSTCHFDRSYVCRYFHRMMGCTMTDYLNNIRLQHAATLLQYSTTVVSTIAYEVGFSSVPYFNTIFKRRYGQSPTEFRKARRIVAEI